VAERRVRRKRTSGAAILALVALMLGLAACGGGGSEGEEGEARVACTGTDLSSVKLPAGFPKPDGVVYTEQTTAGPTEVVDGYYEGGLESAYDGYKDSFDAAGYDILFDEIEEHDAEVSYRGEGRSGQVALRDECEEEGRISVHVTSRPA
jgi:hypothetical protein